VRHRRRPSRPIADLLPELGGVGGSLGQEAEALFRGLHPQRPKSPTDPEPPLSAAQVRTRRACSRLLQTRDGQVLGRRRQALADLVGAGETLADMRTVLERFVDSRLLVLDGEETEATVEIGHESLGRSWQLTCTEPTAQKRARHSKRTQTALNARQRCSALPPIPPGTERGSCCKLS